MLGSKLNNVSRVTDGRYSYLQAVEDNQHLFEEWEYFSR